MPDQRCLKEKGDYVKSPKQCKFFIRVWTFNTIPQFGAGGGNRTRMEQAPLDFESSASTSFTTPACN
jgi:hypothetical protein